MSSTQFKGTTEKPSTWKRNTPIFVAYTDGWQPRHFSHIDERGHVYFYSFGKTSFTTRKKPVAHRSLDKVRKATEEELK